MRALVKADRVDTGREGPVFGPVFERLPPGVPAARALPLPPAAGFFRFAGAAGDAPAEDRRRFVATPPVVLDFFRAGVLAAEASSSLSFSLEES